MVNRRTLLLGTAAVAGTMLLGACGGAPEKPPARNTPPVRTGYLDVPGARLYYETRGSGQPLLMIHGGAVDAGSFAAIAPKLAENYLVITYDRRGNSRSHLDSPSADLRLDQQADDAVRLLKELVDEPPHVFSSSGGGVVALELAARYGEHLGVVVSHEPPVPAVLPDAAVRQAEYDAAYRTYREEGVHQGYQKFMAIDPGESDPKAGPYPADPDLGERIQGNLEFLLAHEMLPFTKYQPDLAALRAKQPELVLGVARYQAKVATRIVVTLADRLGTKATEFPGDHTGYMWRPTEFADKLHATLS
jgi:acetyltransferase/esterase